MRVAPTVSANRSARPVAPSPIHSKSAPLPGQGWCPGMPSSTIPIAPAGHGALSHGACSISSRHDPPPVIVLSWLGHTPGIVDSYTACPVGGAPDARISHKYKTPWIRSTASGCRIAEYGPARQPLFLRGPRHRGFDGGRLIASSSFFAPWLLIGSIRIS
jgi:hypothetical protein